MTKEAPTNFSKAYEALQKIVAWFAREDVALEEGIKTFEEGMELVTDLKTSLNTSEIKIKELKKLNVD